MHVGQAEVDDDHIRCRRGEPDRLSTVLRHKQFMTELGKELAIEVLDHRIIFDGENPHALTLGAHQCLVSSLFVHPKLPRDARVLPCLDDRRTAAPSSVFYGRELRAAQSGVFAINSSTGPARAADFLVPMNSDRIVPITEG
jgi:hypothetical protein